MTFGNKVTNFFSSIFVPFITLMIGSGILKGLITLLSVVGVLDETSTTYIILNIMSDALFYFLPLFLAITSADIFNVDKFIALLIATLLVHPGLTELMNSGTNIEFLNIGVQSVNYPSSVIPIILAIFLTSYVQRFSNKIIPETFRGIFVPVICLVIVVPITLIIFGPIGSIIGVWLARGYEWIYELSPLIAGAFIGAFQPFLVMFGMHFALFTVSLNNIAVYGFDTILALFGGAIFAQGGANLAVALKTKDKKFKSQAFTAAITILFGITEPAMYGVNLRLKKTNDSGLRSWNSRFIYSWIFRL